MSIISRPSHDALTNKVKKILKFPGWEAEVFNLSVQSFYLPQQTFAKLSNAKDTWKDITRFLSISDATFLA